MNRVSVLGGPSIVRLQSRSIPAYKCISKFAQSRPPCASPNLHDHGLQVYLHTHSITACKFTWSWSPSPSPNFLAYGPQVCTIMALKCISPNSLNQGLQVFLQTLSIIASNFAQSWPQIQSPNSLDPGLGVHLQTCSITASKCLSKYAQWLPPSASPNAHDHGLRVYLSVHSIVIFRRISNFSHAKPTASPHIPCVDG